MYESVREYLRLFEDCFARSEPFEHLVAYVNGQLSELRRKSIGPLAHAAGIPPRTLQHFLSRHAWDEEGVLDALQQIIGEDYQHPCSIGVIQETAHLKKGGKTPGVQRQWCGKTGKMDNCVLTVHLEYATGDFHSLLDGELFLPGNWVRDRKRCRSAGIVERLRYRPKWRIALAMYQRAVANGVRFEWLSLNEQYGQVTELLFQLDGRGQRYIAEVPRTFTGWAVKPSVLQKGRHRGATFSPEDRQLKSRSAPPICVEKLLHHYPVINNEPWQKVTVPVVGGVPIVCEAKAADYFLERNGLPTRSHRVILMCRPNKAVEIRYFVSNAPRWTPLELLLHVAISRNHIEQCFQREKEQLGLSDFEVRNYLSLRRHLILTAVSHLFLTRFKHVRPKAPDDRERPVT